MNKTVSPIIQEMIKEFRNRFVAHVNVGMLDERDIIADRVTSLTVKANDVVQFLLDWSQKIERAGYERGKGEITEYIEDQFKDNLWMDKDHMDLILKVLKSNTEK